MKKLIVLSLAIFTVNLYAWEKTCDAKTLMYDCTETSANFGAPMQCAVGLPATGRHCTKNDDLGMCRYTSATGNYKTITDTYYYVGYTSCYDLTPEECTAQLADSCRMIGEQQWFPPASTH